MIFQAPQHTSDGPQVTPKPPEVPGRLCHSLGDLGVEPDAKPVVEPHPINLARVHDPNPLPGDYLQRPSEARAHPERLDVVVAAAYRKHPHYPLGPHARRRNLMHRTVAAYRHDQRSVRQPRDDSPGVSGPPCNVPHGLDAPSLQVRRDLRPPRGGAPSAGCGVQYQVRHTPLAQHAAENTSLEKKPPGLQTGTLNHYYNLPLLG